MFVVAVLRFATPSQAVRFTLSEWDYPDDYGQGIEGFEFYENSTGSWVQVGGYRVWNESSLYVWNYTSLKLRCWTYFNSTHTGSVDTDEGKLHHRHAVDVTLSGVSVFSQQNFTFVTVSTYKDPMWWYAYDVVINLVLGLDQPYTIEVTYEVVDFFETE